MPITSTPDHHYHHSRTTLNQSNSLRPLQTTRTFFRTTRTVSSQPITLLATLYSFQQFKTINTITHHSTHTHHQSNPLKSLLDRLNPLQDHHLCFRPTQTNPGYSMSIAATPDSHYHHPSLQNYLPDHCRRTGLTPWLLALFQTNHDLAWLLHNYPNHSRLSTPSPITSDLEWTRRSLPDHSIQPGSTQGPPALF